MINHTCTKVESACILKKSASIIWIFVGGGGRAKRARSARRRAGERSASALVAPRGARVRCAPARRSSCGRGPGAQPLEIFLEIIPSRVTFYNRVHFFTPVFKILKVVLYIQLYRIITSFVSASCILIFNGCLLIIKVVVMGGLNLPTTNLEN